MENPFAYEDHTKTLTDIGRIILGEESQCYDALDDHVIEWVNDVIESLKPEIDLFGKTQMKSKQRIHDLYLLLRECVMSNRWEPATEVLLVLAGESSPTIGATIQRVATQIVYQNDCHVEGEFFLKRLPKDIQGFKNINYLKLVYERMLYLLSQNQLEEIRKFKTSVQNVVTAYRIRFSNPGTKHLDTLIDAYQGMIYYIEWKTSKAAIEQSQSLLQANPSQLGESMVGDCATVDRLGQQALECFAGVNKTPGVFDIFLDAQIEIYLEQEEKHKAVELLEQYVTMNPDNQGAMVKLYYLYGTGIPEKKLELLKDICKLNPLHPLSLKLYKQLQDKGEECIYILFKLLDCEAQQNELHPWKLLSEQLLQWKRNGADLERHLSSVWHCDRISWWPAFHFTRYSLLRSSVEVLECKIIAAYVLLDKERAFLDELVREQGLESAKIASLQLKDKVDNSMDTSY